MGRINLIGIGEVRSKRADSFKVGDSILYNYGAKYKVKKVTTKGKSVYFTLTNKGMIYDIRKLRSTQLGY
jgi:hypothetical protein